MNNIKKGAFGFIVLLIGITSIFSSFANTQPLPKKSLEMLEKNFDGKIGVYAIDTNSNQIIAYRANERFPVQSTMKLIAVSALFKQSDNKNNLLKKNTLYKK